jgi:hypothetical protein
MEAPERLQLLEDFRAVAAAAQKELQHQTQFFPVEQELADSSH